MQYSEVAPGTAKPQSWDNWAKWVVFLMLGYALIGRSFAYLGIPQAKVFIGDLTLAAFIFLRPRKLFDPWIGALTTSGPLSPFAWVLLGSIGYGIFEVIRGVLSGFSPLIALENLVFNVYPLFMFLGIWVGARHPQLLLKFVQFFAISFCIYAPAYFLFLHNVNIEMPGADGIGVFGQPGGGGFIILALLCLDPKPSRFWLPMTLGAILLLAGQVRAEWLGLGVALLIWGVLAHKMTRVAMVGAGLLVLLAIGFALDVNIPAPAERGGAISSREIVARGLSAINPELAKDYTDSDNTGFYAGTITWRENWWDAIWANSQESYTNLLIGPGYGYLLRNLVNYLKDLGNIRTPHNIFFYALGYSGWIGVAFFFSLQAACGGLLWRAYKLTGQSFGLAIWASSVITAFFGNSMETPAGAIPFYLMLGLFIGPTLSLVRSPVRQERFHLEPPPPSLTLPKAFDGATGGTGCGKTPDSGENRWKAIPSGAKARVDYIAFAPGINLRPTPKPSFPAAWGTRSFAQRLHGFAAAKVKLCPEFGAPRGPVFSISPALPEFSGTGAAGGLLLADGALFRAGPSTRRIAEMLDGRWTNLERGFAFGSPAAVTHRGVMKSA